jgi:pimeloyl-ACP methyl ester carboxylesterase
MPFAEAGDHRVWYEQRGEGEPVLLLAGLGADHTAWAVQEHAFSSRHRVIVFDNPGVGRTEGPRGPYTTALFADVAAGLLRRLGLSRVHVVGASLGGCIAQELALRYPELVRSLALHGTWGRADRYLTALVRSWQASARVLEPLDFARQVWLSVYTVWWWNDAVAEREQLESRLADDPLRQGPDAFDDQAEACITHDALEQLTEIEAPVLLTVGDRDVLTPPHLTYALKDRLPGARVRVWQKMGHAPFWEIPDEFNRVNLEWMEEQGG